MPLDRLVLIYDAYVAAEKIGTFVSGKSFTDYNADDLLRSAVERQFGIIGEALDAARRNDPLLEEQITNLPGIVATRNFLGHAYHAVINAKLWGISQSHLPLLRRE